MLKNIMLVGTASNVGKSVLCTALCRIFSDDGYLVAPFKAQNMSLNAAVTPSGREIGRAQAAQAEAARVIANEHMNPILLKPTGEHASQVIVQGQVHSVQSASTYFREGRQLLWHAVEESYEYLRARHDLLVIEGAGSPVELNLKSRDIANMRTAKLADAAVLLVADIDRGGIFAAVYGTLALLDADERIMIKGILVNRFRGDPTLFVEGRVQLAEIAGIPVLGVIPFVKDVGIDEEDSVAFEESRYARKPASMESAGGTLRIAIIHVPHISNFTDFDPLFLDPAVTVSFARHPSDLRDAHVIILPGTKNTMEDLQWLRKNGFDATIAQKRATGASIFGICGGYQMLGTSIHDPFAVESTLQETEGLCFIPMSTQMSHEKRTVQVCGRLLGFYEGILVEGYEIHMGVSEAETGTAKQNFAIVETTSAVGNFESDGYLSPGGDLIGTYLHGIFHNDSFRTAWLEREFQRFEIDQTPHLFRMEKTRETAYDSFAKVVRENVDMETIYRFLQ